eukprot:5443246-Pyramimonas_sp.AAC.1
MTCSDGLQVPEAGATTRPPQRSRNVDCPGISGSMLKPPAMMNGLPSAWMSAPTLSRMDSLAPDRPSP